MAGALTTGSMNAVIWIGEVPAPFLPVPAPNFSSAWLGFVVWGLVFLLIGSAGFSLRNLAPWPLVSNAAGLLSILGGVFLICSYIWNPLLFVGSALMLASFALWMLVFISSKRAYS